MSGTGRGIRNHDPAWQFNAKEFAFLLKLKGLTCYDLERSVGVDHGVTHRLMTRETMNPRADILMSIAEGLGVDPRDLMMRR